MYFFVVLGKVLSIGHRTIMNDKLPSSSIADSAEFTCFLGSRGILTSCKLTVPDILYSLQFFYPFDVYLRKRSDAVAYDDVQPDYADYADDDVDMDMSRDQYIPKGRRDIAIQDPSCKATVFEIKLEHVFDPNHADGAILWIFTCFNDDFYFDAKHLLHDMRVKCELATPDKCEFPNGILSELVFLTDDGFVPLNDLLVHKEPISIYRFPWPMEMSHVGIQAISQANKDFCQADGNPASSNMLTSNELRRIHNNPYQHDRISPSFCHWRGLIEIKSMPATKFLNKQPPAPIYTWTHTGVIVQAPDRYQNKCTYIHPKLSMYFAKYDQRNCVENIYKSYSARRSKKSPKELEELLREELALRYTFRQTSTRRIVDPVEGRGLCFTE